MSRSLADRLWDRVTRGPDCWEWQGCRSYKGYGQIGVGRQVRNVHRLAWELTFGPIPQGLWVLHRCDNRRCVNPDHLWLGTAADNTSDMVRKGRQPSYWFTSSETGATREKYLEAHR